MITFLTILATLYAIYSAFIWAVTFAVLRENWHRKYKVVIPFKRLAMDMVAFSFLIWRIFF